MIYILCPEKYATGGTELLHQLYFEIKKLTSNVRFYYFNYSGNGSPINSRFKIYDVKYVTEIKDENNNVLIIPETSTEFLKKYPKTHKIIYWLSVDYYTQFMNPIKLNFTNIKKFFISHKHKFQKKVDFSNHSIIHMYQSHYAKQFLEKNNASQIYSMSDPISDKFLNKAIDIKINLKENVILYNPYKGHDFTKKIINYDENNIYIPLEKSLTQDDLIKLYTRSKIYIDFGHHPGKDRIPREAAHFGCIVITSNLGSSKYYEDVSIDGKYKFDLSYENIDSIIKFINQCLYDYDKLIHEFDEYRTKIKNEKVIFKKDIDKIWKEILIFYNN